MALDPIGAVTTTVTLAAVDAEAGVASAPVQLLDGVSSFRGQLVCDDWLVVPGVVISITIERSVDGGKTWEQAAAFQTISGEGPLPTFAVDSPVKDAAMYRSTVKTSQLLVAGISGSVA